MFKQLAYFHSLQQDIAKLEDNTATLNSLLSEAYSPPEKIYCSLKDQIESILAEESQLQDVAAVISQQVGNCTFIPSSIDDRQLSSLNSGHSLLPEWFAHVFEKEYGSHKGELDQYAANLFKLHELGEKRNSLSEEKSNMELLYRRFLSLAHYERHAQGCSEIDIMEDVNHLKNRIRHTRKSFQYFCSQVSAKIGQFVDEIVNKTRNFSAANPIKSNYVRESCREEVFVEPVLAKTRSYNPQYSPRQHKSVRFDEQYHSPSSHVRHYPREYQAGDFESKVQRQFQKLDQYKSVRSDYKVIQREEIFPSPRVESKMTSFREEFNYKPAGPSHRKFDPIPSKFNVQNANCMNHGHEHTHTCQRGRTHQNWFRSIKSADKSDSHYYHESSRFKSPPNPTPCKYDYSRLIPERDGSLLNDYYV